MIHKNKISALFSFTAFVILGTAIANLSDKKERNLQVLPKDISDQKLDSIMESYNVALGVKCDFCHVKVKSIRGDTLDYESDKEPMKEEARKMMRMTIKINRENFYFDKNMQPEYLHTVTCKTCHRGEAFPPEN